MTAATGRVAGPKPFAPLVDSTGLKFPLAASVAPYRNWFLTISPTTGYMSAAAANTPNQIAGGFADRDSDGSTTAGDAEMVGRWSFVSGYPNSTTANDAILSTDIAVPFYFADNQTVGKLAYITGSNRSVGGLAFGIDEDNDTPILWTNPLAWLVARSAMVSNSVPFAWFSITDAAANTATSERAIPSSKIHGVVSSVTFAGAAVAADNTDYVTITIKRYTEVDSYAVGLTVATYDSRGANQGAISAFTPAAFALSGTAANLNRLESDIFTLTVAKGGAGKSLIGEILVNGKAI